MSTNKKVICAGCSDRHVLSETTFYRNKRWCGSELCKENIDYKVKHSNYKKTRRKIIKGTFRHGVSSDVREYIKNRDDFTCRLCFKKLQTVGMQVHHIVPVANGGTDDNSNLVLLCYECHTELHKAGWENYTKKLKDYTTKIENNYITKM